jgi:hydrogenase small subunit
MKNNKKPKVLWFQAVTCNGNTHSFLSANENRLALFFKSFDLIYHPSLSTDVSLKEIVNSNEKIDFLLVEGAISKDEKFLLSPILLHMTYLTNLSKKVNM